jgi:integrase
MAKQTRHKTDYPGVYYISFYKDGKRIEQKAGRQSQDNMTPAKANVIRGQCISGKRKTNAEIREARKAQKEVERNKWTVDRLWQEYAQSRVQGKSLSVDTGRYKNYLKRPFGNKEPRKIAPLDVDRLRIKLLKEKSPQTVKHILNLLTWIVNFGVKKNLCDGLPFHVQKPEVNNMKTEDLTEDQISRLFEAIEKDDHEHAGSMMLMALFTGMRRGELFKLRWDHIDYNRGFINIVDPKGGPSQTIPMNPPAKELLQYHPRSDSPFVFPGRGGNQRRNISEAVRKIRDNAGLLETFRPLHGLRHTYASALASSGQVDMYVLQKLLTHKSPLMTARYAHLRDQTLRDASNVAADIFKTTTANKDKVVELKK